MDYMTLAWYISIGFTNATELRIGFHTIFTDIYKVIQS